MADLSGPVAKECVEGYLFASTPLELLLFRRPPARGRIWVPVSGKVEPSDHDFSTALLRELKEETGLIAPSERLIDLDWHVLFRADNGETWRLHAFGLEVPRSFQPRLSAEHDAAEWVPVEEAVRRLYFEDNRDAVTRLRDRLASQLAHPECSNRERSPGSAVEPVRLASTRAEGFPAVGGSPKRSRGVSYDDVCRRRTGSAGRPPRAPPRE